jgi:hypothetical protein
MMAFRCPGAVSTAPGPLLVASPGGGYTLYVAAGHLAAAEAIKRGVLRDEDSARVWVRVISPKQLAAALRLVP